MAGGTEQEADEGWFYERWVRNAIQNPQRVYRGLFYVTILFFLVVMLFPFYWLFVLALTPNRLIINMGITPRGFNVEAFVQVFQQVPFHMYMFNSFVLAISTTAIVILVGSLAGYVFGRLEFPGRQPLMLLILAVSYFPPAAFLLPLFRLFTGNVEVLGLQSPVLFNTPGAMVMPFSALFLPLAIFILATFFRQIPDGLEDAARVEGSTRIGALFRVIMPLSAPGVATAGILTFITVYNEFFFSFIMNDGQWQNWAPLVWGILRYQGEFSQFYNLMAAASIIGVLPVVIIVVVAQEKIVSGLTAGALKE
jgi:multiple sugar transport system permease protein